MLSVVLLQTRKEKKIDLWLCSINATVHPAYHSFISFALDHLLHLLSKTPGSVYAAGTCRYVILFTFLPQVIPHKYAE